MTDDQLDRLDGTSCVATLDHRAQTLTFNHHGAVSTDEQRALSPLVVPLGAIASVECRPGHSTHWFWVVRRGHRPPRKGVPADPCGVVSTTDPRDFADRVRAAVARATPIEAPPDEPPGASGGWRGKLAKGFGKAVVDGFFNTR